MNKLKGIPASNGIAIGPSFFYQQQTVKINRRMIDNPEAEFARLEKSLAKAREQLSAIKEKAENETGADEAAIFEAHALILDDPTLLSKVQEVINQQHVNAEFAWSESIETCAQQMDALEDDYFRARATDIRDVGCRVLRLLTGQSESNLDALVAPSIILARDLMPSETVRLDKDFVLGFCTAEGGPTSHTAILSKALGLPAVVGVGHEILNIDRQAILVIDGGSGDVIINPDKSTLKSVQKKRKAAMHIAKLDLKKAHKPAATQDGVTVEVVANIGNPDDAVIALEDGAEGVGLLRTEFLYLDRKTAPNETEQLKAYKSILDIMGTRPVIIRTLDVGGDKELPYLNLGREANPFLGWRAIRMCLDKPDFFKVQLRALLRASPGHDLRIMFPMIATLEEVRKAQNLLNQARDEVTSAGYPIAENIQVGIMVEIPSTVILADLFAREVDFFSIGTNDLTQYTMAAERTNDRVAYLGDACHPAVLREIQTVIKAAHSAGIWVGLCGELAGDPEAIPILLGLGLDEFSMAPPLIPHAKAIIRNCSMDKARQLASKVVDLATAAEVRQHARSYISGDDVR